jgi:hypothetical protein
MPSTPGALNNVKCGDPTVMAVLRSSTTLDSGPVIGLYGASLPAGFTSVDMSSSVTPAQVPVVVNGAGSANGSILLNLQSTQGTFADHVTTTDPPIGSFSGSTPTTVPLFPSAPAGTLQAVTAIYSSTAWLNGVTAYYAAAPSGVTLSFGPDATDVPTVTKLANTTFSQIQLSIPFNTAYNGSYSIDIYGQSGGPALFTALVSPGTINGKTYVYTVPNVPGMDKVLAPGKLYTVIVTRTGGYAGPPNMFLPLPAAGTSIIFDRTTLQII